VNVCVCMSLCAYVHVCKSSAYIFIVCMCIAIVLCQFVCGMQVHAYVWYATMHIQNVHSYTHVHTMHSKIHGIHGEERGEEIQ